LIEDLVEVFFDESVATWSSCFPGCFPDRLLFFKYIDLGFQALSILIVHGIGHTFRVELLLCLVQLLIHALFHIFLTSMNYFRKMQLPLYLKDKLKRLVEFLPVIRVIIYSAIALGDFVVVRREDVYDIVVLVEAMYLVAIPVLYEFSWTIIQFKPTC